MAEGSVGDRVLVDSGKVGQPAREGEILKVLGQGALIHYEVRWQDGHLSTVFPGGGNLTFVRMEPKRPGRQRSGTGRRR